MYAGQMAGGGVGASPTELAQQQERWETERIENAKTAYQGQITHMALLLLTGHNSTNYTTSSALKTAHELMQGAKTYNP